MATSRKVMRLAHADDRALLFVGQAVAALWLG